MLQQLFSAFRAMLLLTIVTGLLYGGAVTLLCQMLFPEKANGSLIRQNGQVTGSSLLGQNFTKPQYFHPRPSAAGNDGYDGTASGGSNFGPTSRKLYDRVKAAVDGFHKDNPGFTGPVPADAVTASASGLDPHISVANAQAQAARVAQARGVKLPEIHKLIQFRAEGRNLGFLGEPRVNVLLLNLEMDRRFPRAVIR